MGTDEGNMVLALPFDRNRNAEYPADLLKSPRLLLLKVGEVVDDRKLWMTVGGLLDSVVECSSDLRRLIARSVVRECVKLLGAIRRSRELHDALITLEGVEVKNSAFEKKMLVLIVPFACVGE